MGLSVGIVGLPNVGKSTLFNALSSAKAEAANYPFCTIEPNVGVVAVPDPRLEALDDVVHADRIVPATIDFVDIAGLVRGAHKGEGLGNQFLAHIREVDAVVQVARCFEDANVVHVENRVDPVADIATVTTELCLQGPRHRAEARRPRPQDDQGEQPRSTSSPSTSARRSPSTSTRASPRAPSRCPTTPRRRRSCGRCTSSPTSPRSSSRTSTRGRSPTSTATSTTRR